MSANIAEIAPDVYRISIYFPAYDMQFNHFVVKDDEPLLYHTGMRQMFPEVRDAVARVLDPALVRWIGFSHFEVDECGSLNEWLRAAPHAQALHGVIGTAVNLSDFADRAPRALDRGEVLATGKHRFRFHPTPHLPHGWDAGALFEETRSTLFCSDLFHHNGDPEPLTTADVVGRSRAASLHMQRGPLMEYVPYSVNTGRLLGELADLQPKTLAVMHGSSFSGDGASALRQLDGVFAEVFGPGRMAQR